MRYCVTEIKLRIDLTSCKSKLGIESKILFFIIPLHIFKG